MTILITGSLGNTGSRVASQLQIKGIPFVVASRSGKAESYPAVKFDWTDESTWKAAFETHKITAVYIVVIGLDDAFDAVVSFVKLAESHGTKRFVLLSSNGADLDGPSWYSKAWKWFKEGEGKELEWAVLRPSWFQQNFINNQPIKQESRVVSATGNGRVPFINADDIAAVCVEALLRQPSFQRDLVLFGPEPLSYDDVARILTEILGRKIVHTNLSQDELEQSLTEKGLPQKLASLLAYMDAQYLAKGAEDRTNDVVETITGKAPMAFGDFAKSVKDVWTV